MKQAFRALRMAATGGGVETEGSPVDLHGNNDSANRINAVLATRSESANDTFDVPKSQVEAQTTEEKNPG